MTEKRFIIDDAGTLIDMNTRNTYDYVSDVCGLLNELHEENKELKRELQTYRKVAGCFNCHYHNYDWFDDGDEFEVCDKGNDVTEGICEKWEEL